MTFPTLGWGVIDFIEEYLCHGPGDVQGEPWASADDGGLPGMGIDDEEALFICWAYRVWPQGHPLAGRRMVQRAIYSRPKGRRKSELAGAIDCAEALGPVRCDGFDANGEPVGIPVKYPFIRCLATEEEQAGNTYDNVTYMLTNGRAADEFAFDIGRSAETSSRVILRGKHGGEIIPSTSGNASKDGGKESKATADETHLYVLPNLRGMYRTVARNTGKRKIAEPWMLDTTTAWMPGERSVAEQANDMYAHMPVEEAVTKRGVLYDHRQGDEPKRFGDDRSLIKALKPGYGPAASWMDFQRIVNIIRMAEDPEEEAYRYFLNIPRQSKAQWVSPTEIEAVVEELDVEPGDPVAVGFDGSETDDHTALWLATRDGNLIPVGIWAPEGGDLRWRGEVTEAVDWVFSTFKVVRFYGDPPYWITEMGQWAGKWGSPPVVEWWTNRDAPMAVASGALRTAIRQKAVRIFPTPLQTVPLFVAGEKITEGPSGKPIAQWHFENARTRKVRVKLDDKAEEAYIVRKERPGSPLKIDSVPAAVLARRAWSDALGAGEFEQKNYGRASWGGDGKASGAKKVNRADYLPCVTCTKPIHPNLHKPDAPEQGKCLKCRSSG